MQLHGGSAVELLLHLPNNNRQVAAGSQISGYLGGGDGGVVESVVEIRTTTRTVRVAYDVMCEVVEFPLE